MSESIRPRERAAREGLGALENRELLALLLGTGHRGKRAERLADDVLELAQGCLSNLASWPIEGLTLVEGIGPAKATLVAAAMELGEAAPRRQSTHGHSGGAQPRRLFAFCTAVGGLATRGILDPSAAQVQPCPCGSVHFSRWPDRDRGGPQARVRQGLGVEGCSHGAGAQPPFRQPQAKCLRPGAHRQPLPGRGVFGFARA